MTRTHIVTGALIVAAVVLAGCSDTRAPLREDFGNATRHNMAVHIVNPSPDHATAGAPALNGERARRAHERYEQGDVLVPEAETIGGGTGGGGS